MRQAWRSYFSLTATVGTRAQHMQLPVRTRLEYVVHLPVFPLVACVWQSWSSNSSCSCAGLPRARPLSHIPRWADLRSNYVSLQSPSWTKIRRRLLHNCQRRKHFLGKLGWWFIQSQWLHNSLSPPHSPLWWVTTSQTSHTLLSTAHFLQYSFL